jgi:outer membrane protein assembly factor BamB
MKRCLLVALVAAAGGWCLAADWPRWRGPDGTGRVPAGVPVPTTLPAEPKVVWSVKIGPGSASPVVCGGRVLYLDCQDGREVVHAADAATGREVWRADLDEAFKDNQSVAGPRCAPVADGPRVFVQSCRGEFQCLGAADGKLLWRVNFVKDFGAVFIGEKGQAVGAARHGYTGPAVVDGDRIIVGVGGTSGASVVAFDKAAGRVLWKSQNDVPGYSGPVVATMAGVRQVVEFTAEAAVGLAAADGTLLWRVPLKTSFGRHAATPVVVDDVVVVSSYQAGLVGIRVSKEGGAMKAEKAWAEKSLAINFSSPVAVGPYVYGIGPASDLFCADAQTGRAAWDEKGFFSGLVKRGYVSLLVMGDNIGILAEGGQFLLVAADPKQCRIVARTQVCGQNWCNPAYVDGKLFLRDLEELRCVMIVP